MSYAAPTVKDARRTLGRPLGGKSPPGTPGRRRYRRVNIYRSPGKVAGRRPRGLGRPVNAYRSPGKVAGRRPRVAYDMSHFHSEFMYLVSQEDAIMKMTHV